MLKILLVLTSFLISVLTVTAFAADPGEISGKQTFLMAAGEQTPLVVIYTLTTCPHCREAKEYLDNHKIPYVNREVDMDEEHMASLMKIFDSMGVPEQKRGVPLLIVGNRIKIQGFNKEKLQNALKEVTSK